MSVLKIKSNNLDLELQLDGNGSMETLQGNALPSTDEQQLHVALIALSLSQMLGQSGSHDIETEMITIQPHVTEWNSKVFGFTNTKF